MSNPITITAATEQKYDARTRGVAARLLDAREERARRHPHLDPIGQLATFAAFAVECVDELRQLGDGKSGPIEAHEPEGIAWEELLSDAAGWRWAFEQALIVLRTHFTVAVEEALFDSELLHEDEAAHVRIEERFQAELAAAEAAEDVAEDAEPADAPIVPELPAAKAKPYWLA